MNVADLYRSGPRIRAGTVSVTPIEGIPEGSPSREPVPSNTHTADPRVDAAGLHAKQCLDDTVHAWLASPYISSAACTTEQFFDPESGMVPEVRIDIWIIPPRSAWLFDVRTMMLRRSTSHSYDSSVRLMLYWTTTYTTLLLVGAAWRWVCSAALIHSTSPKSPDAVAK